ncbi:MAG: hypothetical protein RIS79_5 [Verrucomicrobiota bacterium]|jgi:hypothetical protein
MMTDQRSRLANLPSHGKMPAMRPLVVLFSLSLSLAAQTGEPPAPPKNGEPSAQPPRRDGERRGPPGMMGGGNHGIRPPAGFEKLNEEERKIMREAFEKAWKDPKVIEARDQALRANENVRRMLHDTMTKESPQVAALLEKMKPPFETDDRGFPILPRPDSPDFVKVAQARLGSEMMSMAKPGKQEDTRRFHERIMQLPKMKEAITALEATPPAERLDALRKIRDLYRQLVGEEFARFRKAREEGAAAHPKAP